MRPSTAAENDEAKTWSIRVLEELLKKANKDMQNVASEGLVHLGQYYAVQGIMLAASYQHSLSSSEHCHLFKLFLLLSLVSLLLSGFPYLCTAYNYARAKNDRDDYKLKYAFAQDRRLVHLYRKDKFGGMYNYVTSFGGSVLLISVSHAIVFALTSYFLCDEKLQEGLQKELVVIDNPIIRSNVVGGCFSVCNVMKECLNICSP